MAAIPSKEVTTQGVTSIRFSFYSDEEVRKLSVKRIITPVVFDNLKNALADGLYDSAMGPIDIRGSCSTCGLNHTNCPGHFGHIDLPLPVYNPLIFGVLYRLLRCCCQHCYHFRHKREDIDKFVEKLQLLADGKLTKAMNLNMGTAKLDKELQQILLELAEKETPERRARLQQEAEEDDAYANEGSAPTSHILVAIRDTISDFFQRLPPGKCSVCKTHSPAIKKQGHTKLFKVWAPKAHMDNAKEGKTVSNPLEDKKSWASSVEQEMTQELQKKDEKKKKAIKKKAKKEDEGAMDDEAEEGSDEEDGSDSEDDGLGGAAQGKELNPAMLHDQFNMDRVKYVTPMEAEEMMRRLWLCELPLLSLIYAAEVGGGLRPGQGPTISGLKTAAANSRADTYKMFFLRVLPISPNKFRPPSMVGSESFMHEQNTILSKLLELCLDIQTVNLKDASEEGGVPKQELALGRYINLWLQMQDKVCELIDTTTADKPGETLGIRQTLEKKEGMFRKNMMGKRVNFAARSVISPDPYIGPGEIGLPPYFAKRLSFPERVTPWNVERLREAVIRGPNNHPGAVSVENERGQMVSLANFDRQKREALAKTLLSGYSSSVGKSGKGGVKVAGGGGLNIAGKIVYRHLQDGDLMLTNRQPTLHKPGLMAHRARVLRGERTIRMHYANCATFNADFDGDEINLHMPQDQLGRAEGYGIVHADMQYIVPTDGKPIRGLIQDHVVSGVLLTKRDTFLNKAQYMQLCYIACTPWKPARLKGEEPVRQYIHHNENIIMEAPTVLKPRALWTGKQVVSTVVSYFTQGLPPLTFHSGSKVPAAYWGVDSGESELRFHKGSLVTGCVDKNQFGKFGLVHAVQELYGNIVAGQLLSSFSRLFTHFLQWNGFTCGIDDTLLVPQAELRRQLILDKAESIAIRASAEFVGAPIPPNSNRRMKSEMKAAQAAEALVCETLSEKYRSNRNTGKAHDMKGSGVMHPLSSEVVAACLPSGQVKPFPRNCLSLMTVSGAKGSLVNFSQISCLLGQQELEGRRVPRMASGKTLPCFRAYDAGARSCGFVGDRFLSGLRPQEYYFHCMAGREGLVDTTVKTSRSGYLQRCMIKNLESLRVHYDGTVRDNCDGSVVQLFYGEDGLDVMNVSYIKQFGFLARNMDQFSQQLDLDNAKKLSEVAQLSKHESDVATANAARIFAQLQLSNPEASKKDKAKAMKTLTSTLPTMALYPPAVLGSVSEAFGDALNKYVMANPDGLLTKLVVGKVKEEGKEKKLAKSSKLVDAEKFSLLTKLKYMRSLAAAGEAVGVIAGQSIGEPSTQMTLNTFHMAGRGEANVTLGIPRLREILMTASTHIKTPVMTLPMNKGMGSLEAKLLANRLRKLRLAECLSGITVEEQPVAAVKDPQLGNFARLYSVELQCFKPSQYPAEAKLSFEELVDVFTQKFCPALFNEVERLTKKKSSGMPGIGKVDAAKLAAAATTADDDDDTLAAAAGPSGNVDEEEAGTSRKSKSKNKSKSKDDGGDSDDDEDVREGKLQYRGGRAEAATYDDGDDEDKRLAAAASRQADAKSFQAQALSDSDSSEHEDDEDLPAKAKAKAKGKAKATPKKKAPALIKPEAAPGRVDSTNFRFHVALQLPIDCPKLLMLEVVERVAALTMVRSTPSIDKVYVVEAKTEKEATKVQTDGINFVGAWEHSDLLDVNGIVTNDISAVLTTYGVEAARASIMHEAVSVFGAYGIGVDARHLSLIADFMTHQGGYRACNRIGIESAVSPFLKMSFETAAHFLTDATLKGAVDDLKSHSSRICVGRVVEVGTGAVELLQNL